MVSPRAACARVAPRHLQRRGDRDGQLGAYPRHLRDLLDARSAELTHRAEVLEQRLTPRRAQTGHLVRRTGGGGLAALLPVVVDREPVCLIPYPLQQVQAFAATGQDDRVLLPRLPHFLQDRTSTRLNSSHLGISYAVFCLKKKNSTAAAAPPGPAPRPAFSPTWTPWPL